MGPRGEHHLARLEHGPVRQLHAMLAHQPCLLEEHAHAQPLERRCAFTRLRGDHVADPLPDRGEVDGDVGDPETETLRIPRELRDPRGSEHHLRGDAAVVVAFPTELVALRQRDGQSRGASQRERDLGTGAATPDHEDVDGVHASRRSRGTRRTCARTSAPR